MLGFSVALEQFHVQCSCYEEQREEHSRDGGVWVGCWGSPQTGLFGRIWCGHRHVHRLGVLLVCFDEAIFKKVLVLLQGLPGRYLPPLHLKTSSYKAIDLQEITDVNISRRGKASPEGHAMVGTVDNA